MKKKTVLSIIIALSVCAAVLIFVLIKPAKNVENSSVDGVNSSRRNESGTVSLDEDLSAVDGSELADMGAASVHASLTEKDNVLKDSPIAGNLNNPLTGEVQVVRSVSIPEATIIGDGNAGAFYSNEDFQDIIPVDIDSFSAKDIPDKYDSRDVKGKCYVTDVKDQGYSYLCWSFAAMGAIESDLLCHHHELDCKELNLSEKHMAFYNLHKSEGALQGQIDDDYRELVNADDNANDWIFQYDTGYIANGGVTNCCISLLTAWKGPVEDKENDSFDGLYGSQYIFTDNNSQPSDAFEGDYHVQGVYQIPVTKENRDLIKQMIMEHGAATVGIDASTKFFNNHSSDMYSHYDGNAPATANHEVLMIGWDDNYSASNFRDTPDGDGAWLCRNSWGNRVGKEGYCYVSYYDETLVTSCAAAYDVASLGDKNWYDNNYQVAGFFNTTVSTRDDTQNYVTALSSSTNPFAVQYEAASDEELKAVGMMSLDLYQQYEIDVYVNPSDDDGDISFEKDVPVLSQKVEAISGGFHTFELDDSIELKSGDRFFILIKPATSGRVVYEPESDRTGIANFDEWQNFTGNIHTHYEASKKSYYISDDGKSMVRQDDKDFFIKAYTVNN